MCSSFRFAFEVGPRGVAWDVAISQPGGQPHMHVVLDSTAITNRDKHDIHLNDLYKRFVISSQVAHPRRVPVSHNRILKVHG